MKTADDALAELRDLHQRGLLERNFDRVPGLLAGLDGERAAAAARLLARLEPAELRALHPDLPTARVQLTGSGLLNSLRTALVGELARHGYLPEVRVADYGSYVFDLGDPAADQPADPAWLTVCVLDHTAVFERVPVPFTAEDVAAALTEKLALWRSLATGFTARTGATLVLNTVPLPRTWQVQLLDHAARARLGATWRTANAELLGLAGADERLVVLDLDPLLTEAVPLTDPRFDVYAGAHLSDPLLASYARELAHLVRARGGRAKKVLAVDLDQTLWGGVLGDDGIEGIEVAHGRRGEAFHRFQGVLKQLQSQGVLLAAVSKNDQEPVRTVLREHPDLLVREADFVRVLANWAPKPENLRTLAAELNLGADSLVFADDSRYECAAVRAELPAAAVVPLDGDPAEHVHRLLADGWFATTEVTAEDRVRTRRYQEESARAEFLSAAGSAEHFLADLQVRVELAAATPAEYQRISQLTLRTNQFNLTTERLGVPEVRELAEGGAGRVLALAAGDRFGSNGIVGAVFLRAVGRELVVDNLVLSCRVFSRGIEQACLAALLERAEAAGFTAVRGSYLRTAKNAKVADFYPHYGFAVLERTEAAASFVHPLGAGGALPQVPAHLTLAAAPDLVPEPGAALTT
ncbi:HAD-IIIC family phosphatase [Kitasatospora sp. NBC_01287]|uniref:HAD-IIIC family phosphatase n=1 Tax=Kitasatospora sp. NBC_01287 TaxID=2903573 RepID=UPI0022525F51|nr:HAD-IIIC family phosphatase [Kitasatospora sp. NBC_01287]MCX4751621.1 HAD-IIIC family phosphatase [Kitasatospora sp. NBC_01287]